MKPIIVDIKEISDSVEVYNAEPHRFILYSSYAILAAFVIGFFWMAFFRIDIVVKSNGMFRSEEAVYEVSSGVSGTIKELKVKEGQQVREGDLLYSLEIDALEETIQTYETKLVNARDRVEILKAYEKSLEGDDSVLRSLSQNPYYQEFTDKRSLLFSNIKSTSNNIDGQKETQQKSVASITDTITEYEIKKEKLIQTKEYIRLRENQFDALDGYYSSIVQNYLTGYQLIITQYDAQIQECERLIKEYEANIAAVEADKLRLQGKLEATAMRLEAIVNQPTPAPSEQMENQNVISGNSLTLPDTVSGNSGIADTDIVKKELENEMLSLQESLSLQENNLVDLRTKREGVSQKADTLRNEKEQALTNKEVEQLASLEQQIESINNTILSLKSNKTSAQIQLDSLDRQDTETNREIQVLTEKGNVAAEILSYEKQIEDYEQQLENFDIQNNNCNIVASASGYFHGQSDLKAGTYIQTGTTLGKIYPQKEGQYYAEIYVENSEIGKLKEGQEVKLEIAAYPSAEYGYFMGKIGNIAKDISVDSSTGSAYYLVKVLCDGTRVTNKQGEEGELKNGMACQAKIVVNEESVLKYLLKEIELLD